MFILRLLGYACQTFCSLGNYNFTKYRFRCFKLNYLIVIIICCLFMKNFTSVCNVILIGTVQVAYNLTVDIFEIHNATSQNIASSRPIEVNF
jgi:hypothetical protein